MNFAIRTLMPTKREDLEIVSVMGGLRTGIFDSLITDQPAATGVLKLAGITKW